jgi:hypothetical protein
LPSTTKIEEGMLGSDGDNVEDRETNQVAETHDSLWLGLGTGLLGVGVSAAIGLPAAGAKDALGQVPFVIAMIASASFAIVGLYCAVAPFLRLPLPPLTRRLPPLATSTQQSSPTQVDAVLDRDQKDLLLRLYNYDGKCSIDAAPGEYECLWVPGDTMPMQWGWERTPEEAAALGKPRGDRTERIHWLLVVKDLLDWGFLEQPGEKRIFQLTERGQREAYKIDRERSAQSSGP